LPDQPSLSLSRVVVGVALGLLVLASGLYLRSTKPTGCPAHVPHGGRIVCAPPGSGVSMNMWLGVAVLVAAIVIAWPYLTFGAKLWVHRRDARRHPATPDAGNAGA
jgi:hypothetical protein